MAQNAMLFYSPCVSGTGANSQVQILSTLFWIVRSFARPCTVTGVVNPMK